MNTRNNMDMAKITASQFCELLNSGKIPNPFNGIRGIAYQDKNGYIRYGVRPIKSYGEVLEADKKSVKIKEPVN